MRPVEVTTTQIIVAGIHLEKSGKAVNGTSLRKQIGAGNPARLMRVWEECTATRGDAQNDLSAITSGDDTEASESPQVGPSKAAEVAALREQVHTLQSQLEAAKNECSSLKVQVQQVNLVVDAVTDDRNRYQLRCAELEGKDKSHEMRIAELNARIDEQRGELHRGSQARLALQKALDALLPAATPNLN